MKKQPSFQQNRTFLKDSLPLSAPFSLLIDVSEVCNLRCNYCFRARDYKDYGFALRNDLMTMETFEQTVHQLLAFPQPIKKISLSGHGEPLCNRKLPKMVKILKEKTDIFTEIHTNGVLLDETYGKELTASGIDKIVISVQGLTAKKYQEVCEKNIDMDKFLHGIKTLYESSTNTEVYIKIVDVALEEGEDSLFYEMFQPLCNNCFIETAIDLWTDTENPSLDITTQNKFGSQIPYQETCSSCFYTLFVAPNGEVYPCIQPLAPVCFGTVWEDSLIDMWNSEKRQKFLIKHLEEGRKSIKVCDTCAVAQNTIMSQEHDSLNGAQKEILERVKKEHLHGRKTNIR